MCRLELLKGDDKHFFSALIQMRPRFYIRWLINQANFANASLMRRIASTMFSSEVA